MNSFTKISETLSYPKFRNSLHFSHEQLRIMSTVVLYVHFTIHDLAADTLKTKTIIKKLSEQAKRMLNAINILSTEKCI